MIARIAVSLARFPTVAWVLASCALALAQGAQTDQAVQRALEAADRAERYAQWEAIARTLARESGRQAVPPLVDALFKGESSGSRKIVIVWTLIEIADPEGKTELRERARNTDISASAPHFAVACLSPLGDRSAIEALQSLASGKRWDSPEALVGAVYAAGFLRVLGDASTLEWAKEALRKADDLDVEVKLALESLRASLEFRLDPSKTEADRAAYRAFERSLWWSLALAKRGGRLVGTEHGEAAERMKSELRTIDPRFVRRVREAKAATREEKLVVSHLSPA